MNWDETLERVRSAAGFCASAGLTRFRVEEENLAIEVRRSARPLPPSALPSEEHAPLAAPFTNGAAAVDEPPLAVLKAEFVGIV
ncbi:MAG: hypothetical protein IAI49_00340, partial [Candidatus Eremiobacteraeota bacterium]|nr:hypothetical protein [Candidatus Eremiobacteraeota bacterium]